MDKLKGQWPTYSRVNFNTCTWSFRTNLLVSKFIFFLMYA
jgi:hypothetical protein